MLIYSLLLILVCLAGIEFSSGFDDYLDKKQTNAIRGIFTVVILYSHFIQYADFRGSLTDVLFTEPMRWIGQKMVVPFLFYSGYGIVISSKRKKDYFDSFFRHRILHTLLYFDCGVLIYLILGLLRGESFGMKQIFYSFLGWNSLGNSNWFVFAILCFYVFTWIAAVLTDGTVSLKTIIAVIALCTAYVIGMSRLKDLWWYDTAYAYPAGMLYALYKDKITGLMKRKYIIVTGCCAVIFLLTCAIPDNTVILELNAVLFILLVTFITYKVRTGNTVLDFLGKYSFDIYILQRIPYILLKGVFGSNILYLFISALATVIISICFHKVCNALLKKI